MKNVCVSICIIILICAFLATHLYVLAITSRVDLLTADSFAILAGSGITNTGTTTIVGDVGSFPTTTQTGFGSVTITGTNHAGDATTQTAKTDLVTAYNDAAGRTPATTIGTELGGSTLTDGVYVSNDGTFGLTGTVTLDGQGDANSVFIFKMATTLTTITASQVVLTNQAQACNVYWQVGSSATLGTTTTFSGNILALTSITDAGGSVVNGRLLARNGAVTLNNSTVTAQTCATPTATPTLTPTTTPTSTPTPTQTPSPTPTTDPAATATPTPTLTLTPTPTPTDSPSANSSIGGSSICPAFIYQIPIIIGSKRVSPTSISITWGPYSGTDTFNVRYGVTNGDWLYNTDVAGFSTTINALPANQPIWIQVAARNNCSIGTYGDPLFVGGPSLPNTGFGP